MRPHFIFTRWAKIGKSSDTKFWGRCRTVRTLIHRYREYKLEQTLWKTVWNQSGKLKIQTPYNPAIQQSSNPPLLCTPEKLLHTWIRMCSTAFFIRLKSWKQFTCPSTVKQRNAWSQYIGMQTMKMNEPQIHINVAKSCKHIVSKLNK